MPITNTEIPITIGVITDDPLAKDKLVSIYIKFVTESC